MQTLWSRAAQLKSTCRCPSCLTASKQGLCRPATTDAAQLARLRYYGNRFAFYSSSILATATIVDSHNKDKKRYALSCQIAEARRELNTLREEQDRRLAALGRGPGDLESVAEGLGAEQDEGWYDEEHEPDYDYVRRSSVEEVMGRLNEKGPKWYKYRRVQNRYARLILESFESGRQNFGSALIPKEEYVENPWTSSGPLKWSFTPELDRRVKILREYSMIKGGIIEAQLGDPAHDLRIMKMEINPEYDDQVEYERECHFEHRVQTAFYLHSQHQPKLPDVPIYADDSQRWTSLLAWAEQQKQARRRLGLEQVPGISLQALQAFTPAMIEEMTENSLLMNLVRGVPSEEAWKMWERKDPLTKRKVEAMAMVMYKLVLNILQLLSKRENARRRSHGRPALPTKKRQMLIEFWSYHVAALSYSAPARDGIDFPSPPLPIYRFSLHYFNQEKGNPRPHLQKILRSTQDSHETKMVLLCMRLLRAVVPIDIHTLNDVLIYLCRHHDYELTAIFIQFLEESHLSPNEITMTRILAYYRNSGRRKAFQSCVARMYGKDGHVKARTPLLTIPFLARSKFAVEKDFGEHSDSNTLRKPVELEAESYQPFPTNQQKHLRVFEKPRFNGPVYSKLIQGALLFGYVDDVFSYFVEMVQYGWKCTQSAFESLLKHCTDTRDWTAGAGIWAHRDALLEFVSSKLYVQVLRLCIACGKRAEFEEILTDGMDSVLRSESRWPVTTLETSDGTAILSILLSWVVGLEQELRKLTIALALEIESVKRHLDNAYGDTVFLPIQVQSEILDEVEEAEDDTFSSPDKVDNEKHPTEHNDLGDAEMKNPKLAQGNPYSQHATRKLSDNKHPLLRNTIAPSINVETDLALSSQISKSDPTWFYGYDPSIELSDTFMEYFVRLENLLAWPAEPGYPTPQTMHDQDYVVIPATYGRRNQYGPHADENIAAITSLGDALDDTFPAFRSIRLERNDAKALAVYRTPGSDVTHNDVVADAVPTRDRATVNANDESIDKEVKAESTTEALVTYRDPVLDVTYKVVVVDAVPTRDKVTMNTNDESIDEKVKAESIAEDDQAFIGQKVDTVRYTVIQPPPRIYTRNKKLVMQTWEHELRSKNLIRDQTHSKLNLDGPPSAYLRILLARTLVKIREAQALLKEIEKTRESPQPIGPKSHDVHRKKPSSIHDLNSDGLSAVVHSIRFMQRIAHRIEKVLEPAAQSEIMDHETDRSRKVGREIPLKTTFILVKGKGWTIRRHLSGSRFEART